MHQYATLEDTVYFFFGANDTSGSGADGATPVYDVRLGGAAADAAPTLSGNATLLAHANYPAGAHEVAIAATAANGFAAGNTYGVFCTLLVDSQNPTGFVGSFKLAPVPANVAQWLGTAPHAATVNGVPVVQLHDSAGAGGINAPANFEDLAIVDTAGTVAVPTTQKVDVETIKTKAVAVDASGTTFPAGTIANTTNITGGVITTVTTLTNLPAVTNDWLTGAGVKADAVTKIQAGLATPTNITAGTIATLTNAPADSAGVTEILTRIPDATAGAAGGLVICGTNAAMTISSATGDALTLLSTAEAGCGLIATGHGAGAGIKGVGGDAHGTGILGYGGIDNGYGIAGVGLGTGSGIYGSANGTGHGIRGMGGLTSGHGIFGGAAATATSGDGIRGTGAGNGTGSGIYGYGGSTGGAGIKGQAQANNDAGLECVKHGTGKDIDADELLTAAAVNTEVVDALNVDTYAEPGQGAPAATTSLVAKIGYLFKAWRNKSTQTATEQKLYADNESTVDQKATCSDDATTFVRAEVGTGA